MIDKIGTCTTLHYDRNEKTKNFGKLAKSITFIFFADLGQFLICLFSSDHKYSTGFKSGILERALHEEWNKFQRTL